jgi:predicted RNA binding protein YcfA (HicA-like mRNA interferase family)
MKKKKLLGKILTNQQNIRFSDMIILVEAFGFQLDRVSGGHHIFIHPSLNELVNLQNVNGQAKPYQVRQFLKLVEKYNFSLQEN